MRDIDRRYEVGGARRWKVTVSFKVGDEYPTFIGASVAECAGKCLLRYGSYERVECISTPDSIYRDLIGVTADRTTREGFHKTTDQETW